MILGNEHISREKQNSETWLELNTRYLKLDEEIGSFFKTATENIKKK